MGIEYSGPLYQRLMIAFEVVHPHRSMRSECRSQGREESAWFPSHRVFYDECCHAGDSHEIIDSYDHDYTGKISISMMMMFVQVDVC